MRDSTDTVGVVSHPTPAAINAPATDNGSSTSSRSLRHDSPTPAVSPKRTGKMPTTYNQAASIEPGSWAEFFYEIRVGFLVGMGHLQWYFKTVAFDNFVAPISGFFGYSDEPVRIIDEKNPPALEVVGVGYGRTGTYSLALALDELGFPTLHTQHTHENFHIMNMWVKSVYKPSIDANKVMMGNPDFGLIASEGFRATMDLPMALYYEQVMKAYPKCKFILTTKPSSEAWFKSWNLLASSIAEPARFAFFLDHVRKIGFYLRWLFSVINKNDKYLTVPFPLPDQIKENAIQSYEEHNKKVRATIPKKRLLEYSVNQGWGPLCEFLEVQDCPTTPFPKSNSGRSILVQTVSPLIGFSAVVGLVVMCVLYCVRKVMRGTVTATVRHWIGSREKAEIEKKKAVVQKLS